MSIASAPWRAASVGLAILAAVAVLGCAEEPPVEAPDPAANADDPPPLEALPAEPVESAPLDAPPVSAAPATDTTDPEYMPDGELAMVAEGDALPPEELLDVPLDGPASEPLYDPLDVPEDLAALPDDGLAQPAAAPQEVNPFLPVPELLTASQTADAAEEEDGAAPFERRPLHLPDELPREELPSLGELNLPEAPQPPELLPPEAETAPPPVQIVAPVQRVRQGPWRVVCYQDGDVVFEHNSIYRVWLADHVPPQWAYETVDGIRFCGRIGTDVNCQWFRQ